MSLLEADLYHGRGWSRVGEGYAVTKKPRGLDLSNFSKIPFAAMENIPQGGTYLPKFEWRSPEAIVSGTYFEPGDLLVGKITPSFQNGKQALITELSAPFGYATTEVIPLHPLSSRHDARFLFFYLLNPDVRAYVTERMEGSTGRKRVPEDVLLDLPIPDFSFTEQKAIADVLEAIHRLREILRKRDVLLGGLSDSLMHKLMTGEIRVDELDLSALQDVGANSGEVVA